MTPLETTVTPGGLTGAAFAAFLERRDEPTWLLDRRRSAWETFQRLPMPDRSNEAWARTDIRLLRLARYGLPAPRTATPAPAPLLAAGVALGGQTTSRDSQPEASGLDEALARQGVLFGSLDRLVAEHEALLKPYFQREIVPPNRDKFSALNAACWSGGTLLYVPRGVQVRQPLHSQSILSDGAVDFGRTLVILEADAEATLLGETLSTTSQAGGLHCGTTELALGPGARLRYVSLQNWGVGLWHLAHQEAVLDQRARLQWTVGALGSRLAKVNQQVTLAGTDAAAQVNGVLFTEGTQHLAYHTRQHHLAPHCQSDLLYKAAVQDRSRIVWRGMIRVEPKAQKTDGYQRNDNLLLSADARVDSIPGLAIEADDVRCTHGSTSGRVNEEQVFYCRSRGLTRHEAVRMIVAGFFQQVFDRIPVESVREALGQAIGRRIRVN